ncbi:dienelactone hydrolase family protein [Intrasporangium flavum]|uniref:dienelactone hydrolase family protein n=1 Tax=Intrasporangium flavum TaxID=1428657 RepID=UPI00096D6497|nr:dienelactone hydrolase family protein [Intrasporangium flavum]
MAEIILFHHVQGLTDGVHAFAESLRAGGRHTVHTPDLFDGVVAPSIDEGFAHMKSIGDEELDARVAAALAPLPDSLVYAGISFGVGRAQQLAQTRSGARGALLYEACFPVTGEWAFGPWPDGVPVQVHGMEKDPFFGLEGDVDAARELVQLAGADTAELFVYPGDQHLFTDASLPSHDADATALVVERSLALLDRIG